MSSEKFIDPGVVGETYYAPEPEENQKHNVITSTVAGIGSGLIKIPEGVVSLAAELIDLGLDTNTAAEVEKFFDTVNPFDEIAAESAAGRLTEALVSIGVPAAAGAKVATTLASKAVKAKRAGTYANLKSANISRGAAKAQELNKLSGAQKFGAIVAGGAAGETFVADVEELGTIGDMFESGPTQLDRDVDADPSYDAGRKLLNRLKFGSESLLVTPAVYCAFAAGKLLATRGKELVYSNSQIEKAVDKIGSFFRPRGGAPQEIFEARRLEKGREMADTNFAMEQVKRIDREVDKIFPSVKTFLDSNTEDTRALFLKDLDEAMFAGDLRKPIPNQYYKNIVTKMEKYGAKQESIDNVLTSVNNVRTKFDDLLDIISGGPIAKASIPENLRTDLRKLMGDKVKSYIGSTYKIFQDTDYGFYSKYKPTRDSVDKVKEIFKRYAEKNGNPITDLEAEGLVSEILKQSKKINPKSGLPAFKYENYTMGATDSENIKTFARTLSKNLPEGEEQLKVIGKGSKAFRELFGEVEDARYSIYEGINKLSTIARKNQLFDEILNTDDAMKAAAKVDTPFGQRGFFFDSKKDALRNLPNNEIVKMDNYVKEYFKDGVLINRLQGKYTTKEIAEAFSNSSRISQFMRGETDSAFANTVSWAWRNLLLTPKAGSQYAKTVLSIPTHFRNFLSSGAFSIANGNVLENPVIIKNAMKRAKDSVQLGIRKPEAMNEYRELLELGVVNSNTRIGDLKNLMRDAKIGESGNVVTDSVLKPMINSLGKAGEVLKRGAKKTSQVMQDAYVAEDDFWKITNFWIEYEKRAAAYLKAGIKKTDRQLKEEAADIVKNTIPNYAYVGQFVRGMRNLPFGNFMSWPSEVFRTGTNIIRRAIDEIKDPITGKINPITSTNPLKGIGMKRLIGGVTAFGALPYGIIEGSKAIYGISDDEAIAAKDYVAPWSKNSQIILVRNPETGKLYYSDWSSNNVYDTLTRPFTTVLNNIQRGIENEEVLMKGVYKGIAQAMAETADPFISESIFTEAVADITFRGGVTKEGKVLYTEQTPDGERMVRILKHVGETLMPPVKPFGKIINSVTGEPDENGDVLEIPDSMAALFGFKLNEIKPEKALGFFITDYQEGERNSRKEFTGGPEGVLKPMKTPEDVIERYFVANKALFDVNKKMQSQINSARTLGLSDQKIAETFDKRGLKNDYGLLINGRFDPFFPSKQIQEKFIDIARETGQPNPMQQALPIIINMSNAFRQIKLNQDFIYTLEDFLPQSSKEVVPQSTLPIQPMPNASILTPPSAPVAGLQNGLTTTENALLSESEKQIRLRQRGLA
jgi:hypothetical protein